MLKLGAALTWVESGGGWLDTGSTGGCPGSGSGGGRLTTGSGGGHPGSGSGGGRCQRSSMDVRGSALLIYSQDFKVITCGYIESSEGVGPTCDCSHSLSIPPHRKPSDSISVVDPIWCRVPPGESDGGRSAACTA